MSESSIGIKLADKTFYPILEGTGKGRKRLILTTVKDNQESVQIDLFQSSRKSLEDALYIGSLVIDNLPPMQKGEPEIEMVLGIDQDGLLFAQAGERETGEHQSLSVSLDSLSSDRIYEIPDFELSDYSAPEVVKEESEEMEEESRYPYKEEPEPVYRKRSPLLWIFLLIAVVALVAIGLLLSRSCKTETPLAELKPEPQAVIQPATPPAPPQETVPKVEPPKPEQTETATPPPPVAEPPKQPEAAEGVWYKIIWGDTLWDISIAFYRTPWLYGKIAKYNKIPNPDLIYAGSKIFIPKE